MPFIPAQDTWRVSLSFDSLNGQNAANVIYVYDTLGSMTGARADGVCDIVRTWAATEWNDVAPPEWTLRTIESVDAGDPIGVSGSNGTPTQGTNASPPMPAQDTVCLSLRTGAIGRSQRGRLYHVGLTEGAIVDGLIEPSAQTNIINCYQALRTLLIADDFEWVVASFVLNGAPRLSAQTRAITDILIRDPYVDRQLRRKF